MWRLSPVIRWATLGWLPILVFLTHISGCADRGASCYVCPHIHHVHSLSRLAPIIPSVSILVGRSRNCHHREAATLQVDHYHEHFPASQPRTSCDAWNATNLRGVVLGPSSPLHIVLQ